MLHVRSDYHRHIDCWTVGGNTLTWDSLLFSVFSFTCCCRHYMPSPLLHLMISILPQSLRSRSFHCGLWVSEKTSGSEIMHRVDSSPKKKLMHKSWLHLVCSVSKVGGTRPTGPIGWLWRPRTWAHTICVVTIFNLFCAGFCMHVVVVVVTSCGLLVTYVHSSNNTCCLVSGLSFVLAYRSVRPTRWWQL